MLSSSYLRNAVLPNIHAQMQYASGGTIAGVGVDYKMLTPRLVTTRDVATDATIGSMAILGYAQVTLDPVVFKAEGTFGENLADLIMIGGYAATTVDTASGVESYTSLKSLSVWGEISTGKELEFALFGGYAKNLGASENLVGGSTDVPQTSTTSCASLRVWCGTSARHVSRRSWSTQPPRTEHRTAGTRGRSRIPPGSPISGCCLPPTTSSERLCVHRRPTDHRGTRDQAGVGGRIAS